MKLKIPPAAVAVLLAVCVLAGCSRAAAPAGSVSSSDMEDRDSVFPVTMTVSPDLSWYLPVYGEPDNPNWALYTEATLTNHTDQAVTVETLYLYPNHMFYGDAPASPVLLPAGAAVELRDTALWELHASRITLESCPVVKTWNFGQTQLAFPLILAPGESKTGTVYLPGGVDRTTALPVAKYTLDAQTSLGRASYHGMAIAPSGHFWGLYNQTAARIETPAVAAELAQFLEESQLLLWLGSDTYLFDDTADDKERPVPTEPVYRAASALLLYLADQGRVQPLTCQSGVPYYSLDVFETVLQEMSGRSWDCSALLETVQTDTQELSAIPLWYTATDVAYSVSVQSQRDQAGADIDTPETAAGALSEATVVLTYYFPSAWDPATNLSLPGERPYRILFARNPSWNYLPFCVAGIEQII